MTEYDHRLVRAAYWAMIDLIDAQVGRMIACLERTGQLDDTLVILSSDHGEMLGDHGIYLKGPFFYDGAVRVPFIVSWPGGIEGGRRSDALVEAVDIVPTLLDAAGLPRHPGIQGRSLWPMLNGRTGLGRHRDDVYSEYYNAAVMFDEPQAHLTMVGTDRYKLVSAHGLDSGELYDLHDDPGETRNLWHDPGQQASKIAMLTRLADRMAWTMDPLPERASRPS
jgi:arylsulfatase A-like enzyme